MIRWLKDLFWGLTIALASTFESRRDDDLWPPDN